MTPLRTKTISTAWAIALLLLWPTRLIAHSVDHAIRSQPGVLAPERDQELRKSFEKQFGDSVSLIRSTLFTAFALVTGTIVAAFLSGVALKGLSVTQSPKWTAWLQYGGIGVLLWATLARVESAIQTWDGGTLPERVDLWLYRSLYIVGSYALALSVTW